MTTTEAKADAVVAESGKAGKVGGDAVQAGQDLIGQLVAQAREQGLDLVGEGGLLQQLTKRVLESALDGEITDHVGHDKHDPAGKNSGNSRNGTRAKTVLTDVGPVEVKVPRDVAGTFEPQIVAKRQRRSPVAPARRERGRRCVECEETMTSVESAASRPPQLARAVRRMPSRAPRPSRRRRRPELTAVHHRSGLFTSVRRGDDLAVACQLDPPQHR